MAEGARLESVYTFTGIGGSNPSLSATLLVLFIFAAEGYAPGKYYVRVAGTNPDRFVTVWLEDGIPIQSGVEMSEPELGAALAMNGRTEAEINQVIDAAWDLAA